MTFDELKKAVQDWIAVDPKNRGAYLAAGEIVNDEPYTNGVVGGRGDLIGMSITKSMHGIPQMRDILTTAIEINDKIAKDTAKKSGAKS